MTLPILEGSIFELSPEVWAVMVLAALVVMEVFQLGPHNFASAAKSKDKRKNKLQFSKVGGAKNKNSKTSSCPVDLNVFKSLTGYVGDNGALLYVGKAEEKVELRPQMLPNDYKVYPETSVLDNYVLVHDTDAVVTAAGQISSLWMAKDRSDAKFVVLYSHNLPSTYAVQCIVDILKGWVNQVAVSVLYSGGDEDERDMLEKREHLQKDGITLVKIDT